MPEMSRIQEVIYGALHILADKVEAGGFGEGDAFDTASFEAEFEDEVLICAFVYKST